MKLLAPTAPRRAGFRKQRLLGHRLPPSPRDAGRVQPPRVRWDLLGAGSALCFADRVGRARELGGSPRAGRRLRAGWSPPGQELERLEVERVEMIRQHLCQYTQLRHETDMFNQSVSRLPGAQAGWTPRGWGWGSRG